ncbi:YciI family protein [Candidatus Korobacter versatilis]|nr:YciI family protein [Candidatus Koribacter versatilis]
MAHFFIKLIGPRPTFPFDMNESERALMTQHAQYFQERFNQRKVLIYGPVMDPQGPYGMGVLEVADDAEARGIMDADPSVVAGLNRYEMYPMKIGGAQASAV